MHANHARHRRRRASGGKGDRPARADERGVGDFRARPQSADQCGRRDRNRGAPGNQAVRQPRGCGHQRDARPPARGRLKPRAASGWASSPITDNGCIRIMSQPAYPNALPTAGGDRATLRGLPPASCGRSSRGGSRQAKAVDPVAVRPPGRAPIGDAPPASTRAGSPDLRRTRASLSTPPRAPRGLSLRSSLSRNSGLWPQSISAWTPANSSARNGSKNRASASFHGPSKSSSAACACACTASRRRPHARPACCPCSPACRSVESTPRTTGTGRVHRDHARSLLPREDDPGAGVRGRTRRSLDETIRASAGAG